MVHTIGKLTEKELAVNINERTADKRRSLKKDDIEHIVKQLPNGERTGKEGKNIKKS